MNIYCIVDSNGNVTTLFGGPQNPPTPTGYTVMQDTDARYQVYLVTQQWRAFQQQAQALLTKSDQTVKRVLEGISLGTCVATNADVQAYMNWRKTLRNFLTITQPSIIPAMPVEPPYPQGT